MILRISLFPLLFLLLPFLEIAGFVLVGQQIGALATVGLVLASTIAGGLLLRHQGFGTLTRVREEMDAGRDPSRHLAHGVMIALAAILLIVPGFLTDIVGLLLFLPPVRDFAWRRFKNRVVTVTGFSSGFAGRRPRSRERDRTIDLDDEDYMRNGAPKSDGSGHDSDSPWRKLGDK